MEAKPNTSGHDDGRVPELIKRGHPGPAACQAGDGAISSMDTSLSNSYPWSSQGKVKKRKTKSIVAIDWLELAGCVNWCENDSSEPIMRLIQMQREAREINESVICNYAGYACLLRPTGIGSGRSARQSFAIDSPFGMIAFSHRDEPTRKLPNFYFKAPGEKCLIQGAVECREFAHRIIKELGGTFADEWVRRIDLAIDLPGVNIRRHLVRAFRQQHFVTLAKNSSEFQSDRKRTGFKVGAKTSVALIAYDKLQEVANKDPDYREAMRQSRWGGNIPEHATRVELQISGSWLAQYGERKADDVLSTLSSITEKLIGSERPWFRLTKTNPDRQNKHQSRAETLPAWHKITKQFIRGAGMPGIKMKRKKPYRRIETNDKRGFNATLGFFARSGARRGHPIYDKQDAIEEFLALWEMNPGSESRLLEKYTLAAIETGTYVKPIETSL
jgi:hypothetical protein